jgi:hypothetical protein
MMALPEPEKLEDQRQSPRYPLERLAKLQPPGDGQPRYCLVTDMSDGGVRLHGFGGAEIPDDFVLTIAGDGPAQDGIYRVIWRLGSDVGAKLIEATALAG